MRKCRLGTVTGSVTTRHSGGLHICSSRRGNVVTAYDGDALIMRARIGDRASTCCFKRDDGSGTTTFDDTSSTSCLDTLQRNASIFSEKVVWNLVASAERVELDSSCRGRSQTVPIFRNDGRKNKLFLFAFHKALVQQQLQQLQELTTTGTNNYRNKQLQEQTTTGTNNYRNKQLQEQTTTGTNNYRNKRLQEQTTTGTNRYCLERLICPHFNVYSFSNSVNCVSRGGEEGDLRNGSPVVGPTADRDPPSYM